MFAISLPKKLKLPRLPRLPRIPRPSDAYERTGKGWIHRYVEKLDWPWAKAWVERDLAHHVVLDSNADILVRRQVRHSAMLEEYPSAGHCFYPADTATTRRLWLLGAPLTISFFVSMTWLMLVIGYSISLGWSYLMFLWVLPVVGAQILLTLPLGNWFGYRAAPKPLWVHRVERDEDGLFIAPLVYEEEVFRGSYSPSYIHALSAATDYKEFGEGVKISSPNVLRAGAFIAGIVAVCIIIWLTFSGGEPPPPPPQEEVKVEWQ